MFGSDILCHAVRFVPRMDGKGELYGADGQQLLVKQQSLLPFQCRVGFLQVRLSLADAA